MEVSLDFLKCKSSFHESPDLENFYLIEYNPPNIIIYCRLCGVVLYERNLSSLRK
jgi:hypothetical protein